MLKTRSLFIHLLGFLSVLSCGGEDQTQDITLDAQVTDIHDSLFIMDMHVDSMLHTKLYGTDFSVSHPPPKGLTYLFQPQADLPSLKAGGTDAAWFGIVVLPTCAPSACFADALNTASLIKRVIKENGDSMALALSTSDIEAILDQKKLPALMGLEGAHGLGEKVSNVDKLYDAGVRYVGLSHFTPNAFAWPNTVELFRDQGLTSRGEALIKRMNEIGMMIDLAHVHPHSIRDVLAISEAPTIVSHTGVRGVFNIERNLSDEDIVAIAEKGGVIGVFFAAIWLAPSDGVNIAAYNITMDDVVDHIDYVKHLVGIDHVGIGSDYDGFIQLPKDLPNAAALPVLTERLLARGYTIEELEKLYGQNMLRVFREVEAVAGGLN